MRCSAASGLTPWKNECPSDHHRRDRPAHFVTASPESKAFCGHRRTAHKPNVVEPRLQNPLDQLPKISRVELDRVPLFRQRAVGENDTGLSP